MRLRMLGVYAAQLSFAIIALAAITHWLMSKREVAVRLDIMSFNILTATVRDLRRLLDDGKVDTVKLVKAYAAQVRQHNRDGAKLLSVTSLVPDDILIPMAERLDEELRAGKKRSEVHGIPCLVKDSIWTAPEFGLPTTCGAIAFEDAVAKKNADVVRILLDAGMILLGKNTLSEMAGNKAFNLTAGWSALWGQCQSAYVVGGIRSDDSWLGHSTPGGSSSGSAVSVSAGMAPIAIGTETDGSIAVPSDRASLYAVKVTVGAISTKGTLPYTPFTDTLGPMGKSAEDMAVMLGVMLNGTDYRQYLTTSFEGLRIGFLDPLVWLPGSGAVKPNQSYNEQMLDEYAKAMDTIEAAGAVVRRKVTLRRFSDDDDRMFNAIGYHDYYKAFNEFAEGLDGTHIRGLEDLVAYNKEHAARAIPPDHPGQEILEQSIQTQSIDPDAYEEYRRTVRYNNRELGLETTFEENEIDVLMTPPTGRVATVAATAGYPFGSLPLGYARFNGRPFGTIAIVKPNREDLIVCVMSAWEAVMPPRVPPPNLVAAAGAKSSI